MKQTLSYLRTIASKRSRLITLALVLLGLGIIALVPKQGGSSEALPPDQCLSQPYEVLAEVEQYQVIQEKTESHGHHHQEILVSIVNGICSRLNVSTDGIDYPFARYIDKEIAIQLNQQIWAKRIEQVGGKEAFEKDLAEFAKQPAFQTRRNQKPKPPEAIYMPFDKYEALTRLGVKLPDNVKPADEPQFANDQRSKSASDTE